jgi:hypothetical protein
MANQPQQPACRDGISAADRAHEADRAVLYGALLLAQRPSTRLKPTILQAAQALLPAVRSFLQGNDDAGAAYALAYAQACGGDAFLLAKRDNWSANGSGAQNRSEQ